MSSTFLSRSVVCNSAHKAISHNQISVYAQPPASCALTNCQKGGTVAYLNPNLRLDAVLRSKCRSTRRSTITQAATEDTIGKPTSAQEDIGSEERLLRLAKEIIETSSGFYSAPDPDVFSEEFIFRGEFVGPECKKDYLENMNYFKVYEAFPDIKSNAFGFTTDPMEPKRVWFFCRNTGTHTGPLNVWPISIPPSGKELKGGPEVFSMLFDDDDKLKLLTVGYGVDRDYPGMNTDGLGALFGILKVLGIPFPSGSVYQTLAEVAPNFGSPRAISKEEDIPEWYKNYTPTRRGMEGTDY